MLSLRDISLSALRIHPSRGGRGEVACGSWEQLSGRICEGGLSEAYDIAGDHRSYSSPVHHGLENRVSEF